jgi:hypothetical protein
MEHASVMELAATYFGPEDYAIIESEVCYEKILTA